MSSNNDGHVITKTITTLQHFATFHHTLLNYSSLHLSILHFLSITLHYPLIWLTPFTFPTALSQLTSLNQTQYSSLLQTLFQNNDAFTALKNLSPFHLTSLFIFYYFFHLSYQPFTSLYFAIHIYNSLHFTSLHFPSLSTFYRLHFPSVVFYFPNHSFENTRFTAGSPYRPFR